MSKRNWVDARWSLGWGRRKLFFVFITGPDNRTDEALDVSDDIRAETSATFAKTIVYSGFLFWLLIGGAILTFATLYLAKSYMGIDLVRGSSPFPNFLKLIGICH